MRTIKLISLDITNIRGTRERSISFGHRTVVSGDNGTGKTTVMDAFTWLCFGKDSHDRTDSGRGAFGIKTVDKDGKNIDNLVHEVTGVLLVDGQTLRLTRRLTENWVKRRHSKKEELDGHTTTCIWNGAEIGVNEWNRRIETLIIPMNIFKMVTNPSYFSALPWKEQLAELTRMVGTVTPEEIAKGNPAFLAELAKVGGGNSLSDRLTTINTERDRLKKRFDSIPSEIRGIHSATPEAPDTAALECEKNDLLAEQERIDEAMVSLAEAGRQHSEAVNAKRAELDEVRQRRDKAYADALAKANEQVARDNEAYNTLAMKLSDAEQREQRAVAEIAAANALGATHKDNHDSLVRTLNETKQRLLEEWGKVDAEVYTGATSLVCPMTGAPCNSPEALAVHNANQQAARNAFNERKAARLDEIESRGKKINADIKQADDELARRQKETGDSIAKHTHIKETARSEAESLRTQLAAASRREPVTSVDTKDIPGYDSLTQDIETLEGIITQMQAQEIQGISEETRTRRSDIQNRLAEIAVEAAKEQLIASNGKKVAALEEEQKNLSQQMADMESERDTILAIQKAVVDEVEKRVNGKFALVKFRTCDWQLNGESVPTCYATLDGVRYDDLNTASQVNAGLDIINTLCCEYQISAPIFIDNAERVNKIIGTNSQLILLRVTDDKELRTAIVE